MPDVVESAEVPAAIDSNGVPVKIRAVRSTWKIDRLIPYMGEQFLKAHLYMVRPERQLQLMREVQLTAYNYGTRTSYTVFFQPNPDGTTTLILGEAALGMRKKDPGPSTYFAPLMPGITAALRSDTPELQTMSYEVAAKESEVEAFYQHSLVAEGYVEREPGMFENSLRHDQIKVRTGKEAGGKVTVLLYHQYGVPEAAASP